ILFAGHNYPSTPIFGVVMMATFCMLLSPILSFITIKSRSIFPAAFFHGVINGSASLGIMIVAGGNLELLNGMNGLAGFLFLLVHKLRLISVTKKHLSSKEGIRWLFN